MSRAAGRIGILWERFKALDAYRLAVNSLTYTLGTVAQRCVSLLLLPFYTRHLRPEEYGVAGLLSVAGALLGALTTLGLTNGIGRYIYYPDQEKTTTDEVVWSPFLFTAAISLLVLAPLALASTRISSLLFGTDRYGYAVAVTLAGVFISNLSGVGRAVMIFREESARVNVLNVAEVVVGAAAGIWLVVFRGRGVDGMAESGAIAAAVLSGAFIRAGILRYRLRFSRDILLKQLRFSLPLVVAVYAFWVIDFSDRYVLTMFLPLSEVGLYNVGYSFGLLITLLVNGFALAWPPFYHKRNRDGGGQAVCDGVLRSCLLAGAVGVVLLSASSPFVVRVFTAKDYHEAYTVVPWVAMAYLLKVPYLVFLMGVIVRNKTWWQLGLEAFAAAANVALNIVLIPVMGREAAALATLLSYAVMSWGAYLMVRAINPIPDLSGRFLLQVLGAALAATTALTVFGGAGWGLAAALAVAAACLGWLLVLGVRELRPLLAAATGAGGELAGPRRA